MSALKSRRDLVSAMPQEGDRSDRLEREISSMFDRLFAPAHPFRPLAERCWHPFTDIHETPTHYVIRMELAGIEPDSLDVAVEGRCVVVRGHRPEPPCTGALVACHQLEISYGAFERAVCLPAEVRAERVRAEYGRDGLLHVSIEKE